MKNQLSLSFLLLFLTLNVSAQKHFDFTVTDTEGKQHRLYEDYLEKGKTVVIKIFFVACPPCNEIAKDVQAVYEEWGEGTGDVEFFEMTTLAGDDDNDVRNYKSRHGITFIGVSADGGGKNVTDQYKQGYFGSYWGTPSFAVIAPNGDTQYGAISVNTLSSYIETTGALRPGEEAPSTNFRVNFSWSKDLPGKPEALSLKVISASDPLNSFDLSDVGNQLVQFSYPGDNMPMLEDPVLVIDYSDNTDLTKNVSASDITVLTKHILGLQEFINPDYYLAADVNGDGKISSIDIITLRKAILGFIPEFPNGVRSYIPDRNNIPLSGNNGNTVDIEVKMIKMGDLN